MGFFFGWEVLWPNLRQKHKKQNWEFSPSRFFLERTIQRHQIWHCFRTINDSRTWNWSWEELRIGVLSQSCATSKLLISGDQWWFRSNRKVQAHHVQYSPTFEKIMKFQYHPQEIEGLMNGCHLELHFPKNTVLGWSEPSLMQHIHCLSDSGECAWSWW